MSLLSYRKQIAKGELPRQHEGWMKKAAKAGSRGGMKRRFWLIFGNLLMLLLAALGIVAGSVWIEDRHPSDDPARVLFPRTQRWISRPIVEALGRRAQDYVRSKAEARYMQTGMTLEETIARFLDEGTPLAARRDYAYRLAREGTPEGVAALLKVLKSAGPADRAFMAELIGKTSNPAAKAWLKPLLDDPHEEVVVGALKGLALIGGKDAAAWASEILGDDERGKPVRIEAAIALGTMQSPAALEALVAAFDEMPSEEIATEIFNGLGRYEFARVEPTFKAFLAAADAPEELRCTAAEALAHSTREAVPLLFEHAAGNASAELRGSAAWAISAHQDENSLGPQLTGLVECEGEADVRRRLYEALLPQAEIPAGRLLPKVLAEEDPAARIAGFNALGRAARLAPASAETATFDQEIVPELQKAASEESSLNLRMRAVFALRRAGTPAALQALEALSSQSDQSIATAARNGLRAASSRPR